MASRTRKVVTTTYSSQSASASGSGTPGTSRRSERSPSPLRATRQQEQEELQGLNDRLANYIDKVRFLEAENSRLSTQVQSTEEIVKREVSSVKSLYESELADARRLLDDTAREKARIQIEANKYKSDYEDLLGKFTRRDREASAYQHRVESLETQVAELTAKLNDADAPRKRLEKENAALRAEIAALKKQVAELKKKLEEETLLRVDLENRLQSLKEELNFVKQVHQQELEETSIRTTTKIEEVDGRLEEEYEQRLLEALREIRSQHEEDLMRVRYELETLYETKIADLKAQADRVDSASNSAWEELRITRKRADELGSKVAKLESENAGFRLRIEDLENQLARERDEFRMRLDQKDGELADLRLTLEEQLREYSDLLDIKIRLDREIEAYRKLLESEEVRLNISLDASQTSQTSRSMSSTPAGRGTKRRRVDISEAVEEYSQRSSSSGYARSASAKGSISISEVDSEGKFIKLTNESRKDVALGSWQLQHTAGEQDTSFKFHRSLVVKPGKTVTVWSSDSGTTHSPPTDIVMKGKRWFVGDEMKTVLFDSEEEEMAECTMSKSSLRSVTSYSHHRSGPRGEVEYGEGQDREKCVIM
ncbi:lamin-B1.S-like [Babylonia areolata]|uniref:lamin-B1.S-like n=1 Tax=Babylonia areolata TaxID=304850 RepID=UPI003FD5D27A